MSTDLWFRRKTYGWGWTPSTWQGAAVLGIYLGVFVLTIWANRTRVISLSATELTVVISIQSLILLGICYKKGESPRWSWGRRS